MTNTSRNAAIVAEIRRTLIEAVRTPPPATDAEIDFRADAECESMRIDGARSVRDQAQRDAGDRDWGSK